MSRHNKQEKVSNNNNKNDINLKKSKKNISQTKRREEKLKMNLYKAEISQVEDYVKSRSVEVDKEIEEIRERMNLSMSQINDRSRNRKEEILTGKTDMKVSGMRYKEGLKNEKSETVRQAPVSGISDRKKNPTKEFEWEDLKGRLIGSLSDSGMTPFQVTETFLPSELARKNEIYLLLEEVVDVFQIDFVIPLTENDKDILIYFYGDSKATLINIKNLLIDLGYWDTARSDDRTSSSLNFKLSSKDDDLDDGLPEKYKSATYSFTREKSSLDYLTTQEGQSSNQVTTAAYPTTEVREEEDVELNVPAFDNERTNSAVSNNALADIHALVQAGAGDSLLNFNDISDNSNTKKDDEPKEKRYDDDDDEKLLEELRKEAAKEKNRMQSTDKPEPVNEAEELTDTVQNKSKVKSGHVTDIDKTDKTIREIAAENVAAQLALENERLKKELGAFDLEFFEELEDLKYKYTKLQVNDGNVTLATSFSHSMNKFFAVQDTIGEGPVRTAKDFDRYASARLSSTILPRPRFESKDPLSPNRPSIDKLAWGSPTSRASNHAADRAKITSSLMRSHPQTYAAVHRSHGDPLTELYLRHDDVLKVRSPGRSHIESGNGIGYRASKAIDGHDLKRSIKLQLDPSAEHNNFESLCERRLMFELKRLPNPTKAAATLMRYISEESHNDPDHIGYVSCNQLENILVHRLGLKLSKKEISLLAMGFASDGVEYIDAEEFNTALQALFHSSLGTEGYAETEEEASWRVTLQTIKNLATDLLTHRKFAHLLRNRIKVIDLVEREDEYELGKEIDALKINVSEAVSKPFFLMDDNRNGIITAKGFAKIIHFFSPGISDDEVKIMTNSFCKRDTLHDRTGTGREEDYITEFRSQQLLGSLRGAASGSGHSETANWLRHSLPGQRDVEGKVLVEYGEFITQLVEAVLDIILDLEAGVDKIPNATSYKDDDNEIGLHKNSNLPPLISGFGELVDALLSHLESITSNQRRQCLIQLHSTLSKQSFAEGQVGGQLDGFSVLKALVSVGFPISRSVRAKFLRSVEENSGKFNFVELCRFLMTSCCNWPAEERQVMSKILKAMGVTTEQRRNWITQLKKDLCLASADYKLNRSGQSSHPVSFSDSKRRGTSDTRNWMQIVEDNLEDGVPASTFLHCLREAGVHLSVDDEATLLDCLDFECQALDVVEEEKTLDPLLMNSDRRDHGPDTNTFSVSLIKYSHFLSVCSRHVGKWYQAAPNLNEYLKVLLMEKEEADITAGLNEFRMLLKTFDHESTGRVGFRPFLVSCRRSRLLSKIEQEVATELAKVLAEEGSGDIAYELFILHMKSLFHQIRTTRSVQKQIVETNKTDSFDLFKQLIRHGSDKNDGTLHPLRRWILRALHKNKSLARKEGTRIDDLDTDVLSKNDVVDLLRDFNVVYSPEDMTVLVDDISLSPALYDYFSETETNPLHYCPKNFAKLDQSSICPTNLIHCLLQCRSSWLERNPKLTLRIRKMLSRASTRAIETLISRLKSYARYMSLHSDDNDLQIDFAEDEDGESDFAELKDENSVKLKDSVGVNKKVAPNDSSQYFISKDAFGHVLHSCGLNLTSSDIDFLADESDASILPSRIRVGILLEALSGGSEAGALHEVLESVREDLHRDFLDKLSHRQHGTKVPGKSEKLDINHRRTDENSASFAIKHLQDLLLNSGNVIGRSITEWSCDVVSLFNGFDRGGGVCTPQDFQLALHILSVRISSDILSKIPRISKSVDMIPYKDILEIVFEISAQDNKQSAHYEGGLESSSYGDLMADKHEGYKRHRTPSRTSNVSRHRNGASHSKTEFQCPQAINSLVVMVRKRLNLFIAGSRADNEHALSNLLSVFSKFDANQDEFVTPRNFCLAVSVLMDGDVPLLTKPDWEAVVKYFQQPSVINNKRDTSINIKGRKSNKEDTREKSVAAGMVHYVSFIRLVLDSTFAISGKGTAYQSNTSNRNRRSLTGRSPNRPRSSSTGRRLSQSNEQNINRLATYQPVQFGKNGHVTTKKKPKSYINQNRTAFSERPSMFRADYDENEDEVDYEQTNTLSGRGIVGARSSDDSRRSNLRRVSAPHVDRRYVADDFSGDSYEFDVGVNQSMSSTKGFPNNQREEVMLISEINRKLNRGLKQRHDYAPAIKELNDELYNVLYAKAQATHGKSSMSTVLRNHFQMEDKNNNGSLSKHSTLAALNGLGVVSHFWSKPSQKQLLNALMTKGSGVIKIEDFMKLVYLE